MSEVSVKEYISQQEALELQAREAMPWDPTKCTYSMGPLRQPIFACRTCGDIGVCYSCSIQCHTECDLVELFEKRQFSCDCGTERQKSTEKACKLRKNSEADIPDYSNRYGQNFKGLFCWCAREYSPEKDAVMVQCLLGLECNEDWYHDHCIMGVRDDPDSADANRKLPGFPALDTFAAFVCWKCVHKYETQFKCLLAHELAGQLIADTVEWVPTKTPAERATLLDTDRATSGTAGSKRKAEDQPYSIFLKEGYSAALERVRDSLPPDDKLRIFLTDLAPFLIHEDPVYQPPEDSDPISSYEAASRALDMVSHERALNGIMAYQAFKTKLSKFLQPFADTGKVVKEEDIKSFFQAQKEPPKDSP
ncbi:AaceriAFR177Cp [[Ashbya] aceris (nom. inval.)]|nr:AaceriAFR177Cp [[Ashbya] aceris (nom. inval.)]